MRQVDRDLDHLDPKFRKSVEALLANIRTAGIQVMLIEGRRTMARQQELYDQGRTTPGNRVTNARPGSSAHNFGLAVDICPVKDGKPWWDAPDAIWKKMADIGRSLGLVAGWYFTRTDGPHFESKNWTAARNAWRQGRVTIE